MSDPDDVIPLDQLLGRFGSARHPERPSEHPRPDGVSQATVDALGELSAALETAEDARGRLYSFHRMTGRADLALQRALRSLRAAGHEAVADVVDEVLVGRDVVGDMWTFQIVEQYDQQYMTVFRAVERSVREALGVSEPHGFEAEMKVSEQTDGSG